MNFNYLVIEGNIGAGKTSLASMIAEEYNARLVLEQFEENPFLPKFYEDNERFAFPVELTFLADRYMQLKEELTNRDLFQHMIVSDYYFVKSLIFSRKTLKDDEYNLYKRLFEIIQQQLPVPDLYVYLHVSSPKLLQNIKTRGRSYEINITETYLEEIRKSYFDYMKAHPNMTILILDTDPLDFVNNSDDYQRVKNAIFDNKYKPGMNLIEL